MAMRHPAVFAMFIFTGASRHIMASSRHMATMLNQSSSGGIGGERDVHHMTVSVHDMTAVAAKGERPGAEHSQRLGEMYGARHPTRRTKVSNSESKFSLQARGSPVHRSLPLHSLAFGPWLWWQGLPPSQAKNALAPSANTSRTSRKIDGAFNGQEATGGGGAAQPSPTPTWLAWLWQGVTKVLSSSLARVLCCSMLACLPPLWARQRALPFALESYRCKPSRLSEVRASRYPAGCLAPRGRTGDGRRASLLLLVPWLAVCTAQGTICSNEPMVCDGTYSGTRLCAFARHPVSPAEL